MPEAQAALPPWPTPRWADITSSEALSSLVTQWREDATAADTRQLLGLWVETQGEARRHDVAPRDRRLALVGLARPVSDPEAPPHTHEVVVIDASGSVDLSPLRAWLADDAGPYVVMHGSQATLHVLQPAAEPADAWTPTHRGDTEIAARLLAAGAGDARAELDLSQTVARALGHRLGRQAPVARRRPADGPPPDARGFTATAASALVPVMQALTPLLRGAKLSRVYALETKLVPAVVTMERTGFGIDAVAFERIAGGWARERKDCPAPDRVPRLDKLLSTYAHWPRDFARRGRIHCQLHPLAAESGRFSCTDPNLQQVPGQHTAPGLRACFVPAPGHVLVIADYAQIELRVAAHLAPCAALRAVFAAGRDPHRATAATITGKPESEITSRERKLAKAVNFGFLFGMGAKRFASYARDSYGVEVNDIEARRAREAFLDTYRGVAAWHRRIGDLGRGPAVTVRTALGRRKRFAEGRFSFNSALNIPVQGTAAEGFKRAMVQLHQRLPQLQARGVLVVHDEYIAEVPTQHADAGRAMVRSIMASAMAEIVTSVPIEVEAEITEHWG